MKPGPKKRVFERISVSLAKFLLDSHVAWYMAGILGMAAGSVWNYGVNTVMTWRRGRPR